MVKKSVIKSQISSKIVKKPIKKKDLLHGKNQFLAVKNETGEENVFMINLKSISIF